MKDRTQHILKSRWMPLLLVGVALALTAPALWTGWQQDDLIHRYFLLGNADFAGVRPSPLELFRFLDGDSVRTQGLMDIGVVPWWTLPVLRLSFWRPLTAFTHWTDYQLWPQSGVMMHLHSLLWLGATVLAAVMFYRRVLGRTWVAGLAGLLFALDDVHGLPGGWLANRNALLSLFFGILVLIVHDRWRRELWRPGVFLGPLVLLLGLLSGESALAVCGYLLAYAFILDSGGARERAQSLAPYAIVTLSWLVVYKALGHGASGSGFYVDALSEPFQFLKAVVWKGPLLLADQWGIPPSSIVVFLDERTITLLWIWAVLLLTAVGVLLLPLVRWDRLARFWLVGMVLSIPLACTTMPHSRLLGFAGIGGMGLLAQWIGGMVARADWLPRARLWRFLARGMLGFFLVVHLVVAGVLLPLNATSAEFGQRYIQDPIEGLVLGPEVTRQDLVIINYPLVYYGHFFATVRVLAGVPVPRRVRVLAPSGGRLMVRRTDAYSLSLSPQQGFLGSPFDRLFRGAEYSLISGAEVRIDRMKVRITGLSEDGRPAEATFQFPVPLEDPSLRWLNWEDDRLVEFHIPAVGDSVVLKGRGLF